MKTVNPKQLQELIESGKKTFVLFSAPWCGPCKSLTPIVEEVEQETPEDQCSFVKVDIDEDAEAAATHQVRSVPTTIVFEAGEIQDMTIGISSKEDILAKIGA